VESSIEVVRVAALVAQVLLPGSWPHHNPAPQKIRKEQGASGYTVV
jgi:hypothetical protein